MLRIPSVLSLLKATATITLLLSATNALAWSAVAAWDGRYAHVTYNDPTPEGAKNEAIAKCEKVTQRECELLGNAVRNTTLVVARAVKRNHIFFASNPDPLEAAQEVMRTCRLHEGDCVITSVAWDGGPTWWAVAFGDDDMFYTYDGDSEESAKAFALQKCEERVTAKGTCKVTLFGSSHQIIAYGNNGTTMQGVGVGANRAAAEKELKKSCGNDCKVVEVQANTGFRPAPASIKQVEKMASDGVARMRKEGRWID